MTIDWGDEDESDFDDGSENSDAESDSGNDSIEEEKQNDEEDENEDEEDLETPIQYRTYYCLYCPGKKMISQSDWDSHNASYVRRIKLPLHILQFLSNS